MDSSDAENPGNNLYVTGLSPRVTKRELEKHFSGEGKVIDVHLVVDPWTREPRGFAFVTMDTVREADRCIKYLDRSVLEGRVITVEKAKRRRGRTPTPGRYLGRRSSRGRRYSPSYSPVWRDRYGSRNSPERERSYSPYERRRSYSPYERRRSYSPYGRRWSYSPYYSRYRSCSRSPYCYSRSPSRITRRRRSYSRDRRSYSYDRSVSPHRSRQYYRSVSRSCSASLRRSGRRSYSRSVSPRRSYSRSYSPESRRSRSYSPRNKHEGKKSSRSRSASKRYSRESYSHSRSSCSRSVSRSPASSS